MDKRLLCLWTAVSLLSPAPLVYASSQHTPEEVKAIMDHGKEVRRLRKEAEQLEQINKVKTKIQSLQPVSPLSVKKPASQ